MAEFPWEDSIFEKKVESDLKDLRKTLVAFANSVKPGHTAVLLIGEKNDGTIQGVTNPDQVQKQVRKEADNIYPPILWRSTVYESSGKQCVRVEIEYDGETPHFGGIAWVRQGSESVIATSDVFQRLIDLRSGMVRELARWLGKEVAVDGDGSTITQDVTSYARKTHRWNSDDSAKIVFVNGFWVTLEKRNSERVSEPLRKVTLSYDHKHNRLKLIIDY